MQKTHGVHTQSEAKDLVGCNGQNSLTDILLHSVNWRHPIKGKVIFHRPILLIVIAPPPPRAGCSLSWRNDACSQQQTSLFTGEVWGARDGQLDIILLTRGGGGRHTHGRSWSRLRHLRENRAMANNEAVDQQRHTLWKSI